MKNLRTVLMPALLMVGCGGAETRLNDNYTSQTLNNTSEEKATNTPVSVGIDVFYMAAGSPRLGTVESIGREMVSISPRGETKELVELKVTEVTPFKESEIRQLHQLPPRYHGSTEKDYVEVQEGNPAGLFPGFYPVSGKDKYTKMEYKGLYVKHVAKEGELILVSQTVPGTSELDRVFAKEKGNFWWVRVNGKKEENVAHVYDSLTGRVVPTELYTKELSQVDSFNVGDDFYFSEGGNRTTSKIKAIYSNTDFIVLKLENRDWHKVDRK